MERQEQGNSKRKDNNWIVYNNPTNEPTDVAIFTNKSTNRKYQ